MPESLFNKVVGVKFLRKHIFTKHLRATASVMFGKAVSRQTLNTGVSQDSILDSFPGTLMTFLMMNSLTRIG